MCMCVCMSICFTRGGRWYPYCGWLVSPAQPGDAHFRSRVECCGGYQSPKMQIFAWRLGWKRDMPVTLLDFQRHIWVSS